MRSTTNETELGEFEKVLEEVEMQEDDPDGTSIVLSGVSEPWEYKLSASI